MKKILIVMSVAILIALCSAPSFVKADVVNIGSAYVSYGYNHVVDIYVDLYSSQLDFIPKGIYPSSYQFYVTNDPNHPTVSKNVFFIYDGSRVNLSQTNCLNGSIPTLVNSYGWTYENIQRTIFNNNNDYINSLPPELQPSLTERIWDRFYDLFESIFGYRPMPGSIYDLLRGNADGENNEITFPTLTPTPLPTPTPTPIPVQTIFVPDGNGNTTIIYQYPDPTSGIITQSPYNPNIQNDITINCDCDSDGGGSGTFTSNPQDPYTLDASLLWADGFGVEISENPLTAVNESQQTLNEAAMEYDESVNVLSNSFNIIPAKWLTLVGLCGGILIIAGLIRSFIGG